MTTRVFITGATGFLGSSIHAELSSTYEVRTISRDVLSGKLSIEEICNYLDINCEKDVLINCAYDSGDERANTILFESILSLVEAGLFKKSIFFGSIVERSSLVEDIYKNREKFRFPYFLSKERQLKVLRVAAKKNRIKGVSYYRLGLVEGNDSKWDKFLSALSGYHTISLSCSGMHSVPLTPITTIVDEISDLIESNEIVSYKEKNIKSKQSVTWSNYLRNYNPAIKISSTSPRLFHISYFKNMYYSVRYSGLKRMFVELFKLRRFQVSAGEFHPQGSERLVLNGVIDFD